MGTGSSCSCARKQFNPVVILTTNMRPKKRGHLNGGSSLYIWKGGIVVQDITNKIEQPTASRILHHIRRSQLFMMNVDTIIITGKIAPTGKTWLCNELNKLGHRAIEITGLLYPFVTYKDNDNHVLVDTEQRQCLIILNHRLPAVFA